MQAVETEISVMPMAWPTLPAAWANKGMRGIYLSRYAATNRASEQMIRDRVRYYKSQGINTIIHGVWGKGCTMYKSEVMDSILGYSSCPNYEIQAEFVRKYPQINAVQWDDYLGYHKVWIAQRR